MAATKTKKTSATSTKKSAPASKDINLTAARKRNIRLATGFICLLIGCFFTLSIISYCFTWQQDQNHLISSRGILNFLFHDKSPVENWCGRLGAAAAHLLVYRGVGIAALLFTIWLSAWGINLVYGRKVIHTMKWIRWMALGFLFICPLLSFAFPDSEFPLGGALGNGLVEWSNGFLGKAGSVFMLITVFCFFAFIVFQWDIKPLLQRAKNLMPVRRIDVQDVPLGNAEAQTDEEKFKGFSNYKTENNFPEREEEQQEITIATGSNNRLKEDTEQDIDIDEEVSPAELEMTIIERPTEEQLKPKEVKSGIHLELPQEALFVEPQEDIEDALEEYEEEEEIAEEEFATDELSFEVKTVEEKTAVPAHGAHITVESGEPYDPALDLPNYKFPTLDLLEEIEQGAISLDREEKQKSDHQHAAQFWY
jgi:S-DNA-T family DNA segregation ATPase FtsK/SpoIIIE